MPRAVAGEHRIGEHQVAGPELRIETAADSKADQQYGAVLGEPGGRGPSPLGTGPVTGQARFPRARPAAGTGKGPLDQLGFGDEPGDQAQLWAGPGGVRSGGYTKGP